jgi:pimeloyl-ACP methyl ester carboxylesterase
MTCKWKGICRLVKLTITPDRDPVAQAPAVRGMLYTSSWLDSKAENDDKDRTNRQIQGKVRFLFLKFPTFLGKESKFLPLLQELSIRVLTSAKPQRFLGHISQIAAALTHHVSPSRLAFISARIPKIIIVTENEDYLVAPKESRRL